VRAGLWQELEKDGQKYGRKKENKDSIKRCWVGGVKDIDMGYGKRWII